MRQQARISVALTDAERLFGGKVLHGASGDDGLIDKASLGLVRYGTGHLEDIFSTVQFIHHQAGVVRVRA
jgi:hypothetical protein